MNRFDEVLRNEKKYLLSKTIATVIVAIVLIWSLQVFNIPKVMDRGVVIAQNIFKALINPSKNVLFSLSNTGVLALIIETIAIAFLGTIIGSFYTGTYVYSRHGTRRICWGTDDGGFFNWHGQQALHRSN